METAWARLKVQELRALANRDAVVIVPVAAIEQHGPHLPVMTDTRIGEAIAHRAAGMASATRPVIVTPVVWSGLSEHHMSFGGTITLSFETFVAVVTDVVESVVRHGFRHVVLSNSHGGNTRAFQTAAEILTQRFDMVVVCTTYASEARDAIEGLLEDQKGVMHAGEAETSMMLALEPDLVDTSDLASVTCMTEGSFLGAGKASFRWRPFAHITGTGCHGNPVRASAEKGEALLDVSARAIADLILDGATWADPRDLRGEGADGGVPFRDE